MKTYEIPIIWESYKRYVVEAENLQEAVTEALKIFLAESDDNYIQDSFDIDGILQNETYEEYDVHQAIIAINKQ
jgi:hypothetical protein